jgi:L-iditol 2-dehydrogenase
MIKKSFYLNKNRTLSIKESKILVNDDEIVLKILECGICSTDLKFIYNKKTRIENYPIILGHEISAKVFKIGKKVKKFKKNQYIILGAEIPCKKKCLECNKNTNLCSKPLSIGSVINGGFTNIMKFKEETLERAPHILKKNKIEYSCLSESIACVFNGLEQINFKKNNSILVLGGGYMGILFVIISKLYGAKRVAILEKNYSRIKLLKKLKFNSLIIYNSLKKLENDINNNKLKKFDRVVSATSSEELHKKSINFANKNSQINLYGGLPKKKVNFDINKIHYDQIKITGSFSSNQKHLELALSFIEKNQQLLKNIVSDSANFKNLPKKIDQLKKQKFVKLIFKPSF